MIIKQFSLECCVSKIIYLVDVVKENEVKGKNVMFMLLLFVSERLKSDYDQFILLNIEWRFSVMGLYFLVILLFLLQGYKMMEVILDEYDNG